MVPVDAVVREAALHSFAVFEPAGLAQAADGNDPAAADPIALASAQTAFADALAAALKTAHLAGLGAAAISAAASAGCAAHAAARAQIRERVADAALHNTSEEGPDGPLVLLSLIDDVLVHFIDRLRSDRWVL